MYLMHDAILKVFWYVVAILIYGAEPGAEL